MQLPISIGLVSVLFLIAYQDFKYRAVSFFLFPVLVLLLIGYGLMEYHEHVVFQNSLINLAIVFFMTGILYLMHSIKEKSMNGFFNKKLGAGDVLFWLCIAPLLSPVNFLLWLIVSLIISLAGYIVWRLLTPQGSEISKIPLAGIQAITLLILFFFNTVFFHKDLSQDIVLLKGMLL